MHMLLKLKLTLTLSLPLHNTDTVVTGHSEPSTMGFVEDSSYSNSSSTIWTDKGRSMRTIRSILHPGEGASTAITCCSFPAGSSAAAKSDFASKNLNELASRTSHSPHPSSADDDLIDFLPLYHSFSDYSSVCSSDISGELHRLATLTATAEDVREATIPESSELERESFSTEIIENISPEDLKPTVKICVDSLQSPSVAVKRSAAAKLRLLAKNRSDNRVLIAEFGAVPALIQLLRCTDPLTQEHAVTALLNLSLHPHNKMQIAGAGAAKSLIYVLKTGTEISKQNAAAALMSLAMVEDNKLSIGACGAIPPLVSLLINGTNRGKKDALTTLYKLCSAKLNKERAVSAAAVKPLVELVIEQGAGMAEKAMVVLSSLAAIEEGREAIVEEGGIAALVEAVEDTSDKGKELAVTTLLQLCTDSVRNRGLLVREGGIPPLVALSQAGTPRAKNKAETLLGYLREPRHEASSSSP